MTYNIRPGLEISDLSLYTHTTDRFCLNIIKLNCYSINYFIIKQHTNNSAVFLHFIAMGCKMPFKMEPADKNGEFISQYQNLP